MPTDSKRKRKHHAKTPTREPEVIEQMVWWCEACKASGSVFYARDAGLREVFTKPPKAWTGDMVPGYSAHSRQGEVMPSRLQQIRDDRLSDIASALWLDLCEGDGEHAERLDKALIIKRLNLAWEVCWASAVAEITRQYEIEWTTEGDHRVLEGLERALEALKPKGGE